MYPHDPELKQKINSQTKYQISQDSKIINKIMILSPKPQNILSNSYRAQVSLVNHLPADLKALALAFLLALVSALVFSIGWQMERALSAAYDIIIC